MLNTLSTGKFHINLFLKMNANLSFTTIMKNMEPHKCRVICIVNGIGDSAQQMRLIRLKQSLNICVDDFASYIREARDSGIIKFDNMLVDNLRNNNGMGFLDPS